MKLFIGCSSSNNIPAEYFEDCKIFLEELMKENDLVFACNSLPFCENDKFQNLWTKIEKSIKVNGFFVGDFFGVKDEWYGKRKNMTFLTREQVFRLFNNFEIIDFNERNNMFPKANGEMKHWHIFWVIAKKIK